MDLVRARDHHQLDAMMLLLQYGFARWHQLGGASWSSDGDYALDSASDQSNSIGFTPVVKFSTPNIVKFKAVVLVNGSGLITISHASAVNVCRITATVGGQQDPSSRKNTGALAIWVTSPADRYFEVAAGTSAHLITVDVAPDPGCTLNVFAIGLLELLPPFSEALTAV